MKYELLLTQLVKVRINALPWATVYVDEVQKGQTPLTLFLSAGTHAVRLEPPDSRWDRVERTLEVGPGQANSLSVSLPEGGGS
jgi:hypothetical protein